MEDPFRIIKDFLKGNGTDLIKNVKNSEEYKKISKSAIYKDPKFMPSRMQDKDTGKLISVSYRRTMLRVGRNDLCPCKSGKKYKHCHGK